MRADELSAILRSKLGASVTLRGPPQPLNGGSTDAVLLWRSSEGDWVSKSGRGPEPRFSSEAGQLRALAAGTTLVVPDPLAVRDPSSDEAGYLVLPYLPRGPAPSDPEVALARGLATLHRSSASAFGFESPTYCGATRQENPWTEDWVSFFRDARLRPLLEQLGLPADEVWPRLETELEAPESPSLVHGDLWSGNTWPTTRGPAVIDPAAAYAHREFELGMATWFGGFSKRFYDAYDEAWPMRPGWDKRVRWYRWYHELNHAVLFGGSYLRQAQATLRQLLS